MGRMLEGSGCLKGECHLLDGNGERHRSRSLPDQVSAWAAAVGGRICRPGQQHDMLNTLVSLVRHDANTDGPRATPVSWHLLKTRMLSSGAGDADLAPAAADASRALSLPWLWGVESVEGL